MKKIKQHKRFTIYLNKEGFYLVYLPGCTRTDSDADWEAGSLQEAIDFIDSY